MLTTLSPLFLEEQESLQTTATLSERYDIREWENSLSVEDIVSNIPLANFTSAVPWTTSDSFEELYPAPTFKNYWDDYINTKAPLLRPLSDTEHLIISPPKDQWVNIRNLFINEEGGQRLQIKDPKEAKLLREHAENFDFRMVTVKVAKCSDDSTEFGEYAGKYFVYDGGGCCMKALLRGILYLPAQIVNISSKQELRDLFYDENTSFNKVKGVELFKKKLVERDSFARLQDRIMERSGVTPVKHHTDTSLRVVGLSPIKQLLEGTFKNILDTSWSGDSVKEVKDPDTYWDKRKAPTIEFALDSLSSVYEGDLDCTFLLIACGQFKAVWNGEVPQQKFINMLEDLKTGKIKINLNKIDPGYPKIVGSFTTLKQLQECLNLTRMATEKYWGVVALSRLWNEYRVQAAKKDKSLSIKKLDEKFINGLMSPEGHGFVPYRH